MNFLCYINFSTQFLINKKVNIFAHISPKKQLFVNKRHLVFIDPEDIKEKSVYIGDFTIEPYDYDTYKIKAGDGNLYIKTRINGPGVNVRRKEFKKTKHFGANKSFKWNIYEEEPGVKFESRNKCLHVEEMEGDFKKRTVRARKCANIEGQLFIVKESKNQSNTDYVPPGEKHEEISFNDQLNGDDESSDNHEDSDEENKTSHPKELETGEPIDTSTYPIKSPNDIFALLKDEQTSKKEVRPKIVNHHKHHENEKPIVRNHNETSKHPKFFVIKAY